MPVLSLKTLRRFWLQHPDAEEYLKTWHRKAEHSNWENPQQVKVDYPNASIISGDRGIFNVRGNNYRLVVHIRYRANQVYVRFIGTHSEYERINAREV